MTTDFEVILLVLLLFRLLVPVLVLLSLGEMAKRISQRYRFDG